MYYLILFLVLLICSCSGDSKRINEKIASHSVTISNDTIPIRRKRVNKTAIASYFIPINNPLLKQYFGVKVYETSLTFQFLLKMQYEGMEETDTLKIPNFGILPSIKIKPGKEKLSCIIGFLDKNKNFKEYKMLSAKGNKLTLRVLHQYTVGSYKTQH